MDERIEEFITFVRRHGQVTFEEAERMFSVGRRTIYNYMRRANQYLSGTGEIIVQRGELTFVAANSVATSSAAPQVSADTRRTAPERNSHLVPIDHAERVTWLLQTLLISTEWTTIDQLAERMYVARRTVSHDLRDVERELSHFNLTLEKRPRYGMRVAGTEMMRRLCLVAALGDAINVDEGASPRCFIDGAAKVSSTVALLVAKTLEQETFSINAFALHGLIAHVTVTVMRLRGGSAMTMEGSQLERIVSSREFPVAERLAQALAEEFDCTFPIEDVAYITIHLAGRQSLYDIGDNDVLISDEIWDVVTRMLERVYETYRIDFSSDLELRMNLARHIVPLSVRLHYHMNLDNPMLEDIRAHYPLAFAMAADTSSVLVDAYGVQPSEEEVGYLAMAFVLAIERQESGFAKKRVLLVCASGASTARLLKVRLEREFHDCIAKLDVCDASAAVHTDWTQYDYVFTTVPLPSTPPIPVYEVDNLFDPKDATSLRATLRLGDAETPLRVLFSPRLFFNHVDVPDKQGVLEMLCTAAIREIGLEPSFTALVFQREELAPTAFGNSVAMPHPAAAVSERSFVAVALLEHPIFWNERADTVRAVFLVSPSRTGGRELNTLFGKLAELFSNPELMKRLVTSQTFDTLMSLVEAVGG